MSFLLAQNLDLTTVQFLIAENIPIFSAGNNEVNLSQVITFTNNLTPAIGAESKYFITL